MKLFLILSSVVLYVALTSAQSCPGRPPLQDCLHGKDEGVEHARLCIRDPNPEMWYYNHHENRCIKMRYLGCLGNRNRYCKLTDCQRACVRRV
ncbi:kunitz-type serine protease inhibitor homolog dendrotoxin I [Drosophila santomea]|uniref:kunitz-type serine protease inhibitor homolog dendrotoxin I n=1 Tax=Drosophila santomea TaxID=129105 RepID=UPI001953ABEA|nr:kunitz-type serine protease inhibitor homolog dendrotoxin I [Drosophila santomea]